MLNVWVDFNLNPGAIQVSDRHSVLWLVFDIHSSAGKNLLHWIWWNSSSILKMKLSRWLKAAINTEKEKESKGKERKGIKRGNRNQKSGKLWFLSSFFFNSIKQQQILLLPVAFRLFRLWDETLPSGNKLGAQSGDWSRGQHVISLHWAHRSNISKFKQTSNSCLASSIAIRKSHDFIIAVNISVRFVSPLSPASGFITNRLRQLNACIYERVECLFHFSALILHFHHRLSIFLLRFFLSFLYIFFATITIIFVCLFFVVVCFIFGK